MNKLEYNQGREIISPKMPEPLRKKWTGKRKAGIICICAGLLLAFLLSPVFDVADIRVNGTDKIPVESAISASGIVKGASIFKVNPGKIESKLTTMAYVDTVEVKRKFPSVVEINITESREAAYIYFIGNYVGIDENGKILEIKQSAEDVALPVIVGTNVTEFGIGNMIKIDDEDKQKTVFDIVKQLGTAEIRDSIKTIDVFDLNDIRFFTISEATVNMGSMDDMIYKIAFLKKILEDNGDNRGAFIDMTNTDKVTVRGS
ncbi:MAG: FtsQ-type POTRA domain-containing protein [Ruminococcaceae bacterium]|nr:FtsQ-type POTRA domain-containing protein [Oscillospiraceae bacterium]